MDQVYGVKVHKAFCSVGTSAWTEWIQHVIHTFNTERTVYSLRDDTLQKWIELLLG